MEINLDESALKFAADWLAMRDPMLAQVLEKYGYPPLWAREPGFPTLVHIILEQQVSLVSAKAAFFRLETHLGKITPANLLNSTDQELFQIGFSRQKKVYVRCLAEAVMKGEFVFETLAQLPEDALRVYMKRIKGIGDWTVDVYALMCLLRPDILPKGDIALYESYRVLRSFSARPKHDLFVTETLHWKPWRSVAARMLWHFYLCERAIK